MNFHIRRQFSTQHSTAFLYLNAKLQTTVVPVASVHEESEDGGEEDDGDGEDEVLAKVPLGPEGAEVAVVDVDQVALLAAVVVSDAEVAHVAVTVVAPRHEEEQLCGLMIIFC